MSIGADPRARRAIDFDAMPAHLVEMSDELALLSANGSYYRAFSASDFTAMSEIWGPDDITCVHPGWPALIGREKVLASYRDIMRNPGQEPIECRNEQTLVAGAEGRVFCVELVGGAALIATNWFRLIDGAWRLVHHQASPLASFSQGTERPRSLH